MRVVGSKCYCDPKCHTLVAHSGQTQGVGGLLLEPTWEHVRGQEIEICISIVDQGYKICEIIFS